MTIIQEVIKLIGRHETGRIMKFSGKENLPANAQRNFQGNGLAEIYDQ